jgi:gliding motility-associated-like protein
MKKELYNLWVVFLFLLFPFFNQIAAQDNLKVDFANAASVPDFLNICGDEDTEVVEVSVDGLSSDTRSNILATAHLFKGVEFVSFDPSNSSPGVSLDNASDPSNPVFIIPSLSPFGTVSVNVAFSVKANCEYVDTLSANNAAQVYDLWEFSYDLGATTGLTEFDANIEYRDAFAVPSFTIDLINTFGPARVGDCYSRDIVATNSGLDGFVDTIMYTNIQGPGVYVESIFVNGIPVTMNKQVVGFDTLITVLVDGTQFINNTIGMGAGDGDVFFDPNETITITENICVLDCFMDRSSFHSVEWGCNGRFCETTSINGFADIGQGAANLVFASSGSLPNIYSGYCQTGQSTVTFLNDGLEVDPGYATMIDVSVGIGLGSGFALTAPGFDIIGVRIAGVDISIPATMVDLEGNLQFTADPDGAGGLTDFDGDGFFDDLPLNESIEITVFYAFDCGQAQALGGDATCSNNFSTAFNARIDHTNACDERIIRLETNYFRPSNSRSELENFTDTDAFALTDTFYITHTQTRGIRYFDKNCSSGEQFLVTVVLPTGVTIIPSVTEVLRNEVTSFPLISSTISNDTTYLVFDASVTAFINGEYIVKLGLQADCSAALGATSFPTEFAFYCPDCDCKHIWFCGDMEGPYLHSTNPPCPPVTCPIGLRTTSFDVNRTTFGYTDQTYTTPFDPSMANTKVAISCDSVEMRIINIVGDTPITDSIGMVITYNNVDGSSDLTETFLFGLGYLRITNGGNEYFCTVDTSILDVEHVDSIKTLTFDLDPCLIGLGITLAPGDTVDFRANFTVNPNGPYPVQFKKVQNLRGYGFAKFAGVDESCDNFGDIITIAKNQTVFNYPNSSSFPEGCEEVYLNYRLITVNNGFIDWFGNEYRQAIGIDSLVINFDTAVYNAFTVFEPEVSIPDHPIHGNSFFSMPSFESFPDGRYVVRFDTLTTVPSLNNVLSYSFNFRIRVVPNCKSLTASSNGNNQFDFDPEIYFEDRYYANDIGDGSCSEKSSVATDNDIFYTDPPTFSLNYVSNPNYNLASDTAIWIVQHCNTSFVSDAGLTWLSIEDSTQAIEVMSIEDISDPLNITSLSFYEYGIAGGNYFAFTPGLTKGDGSAPIKDVCNTIRIKALVNKCGVTNFETKVGWNCVMYPQPVWTPELYPPCQDLALDLSVTTLDPFIAANIIEQPLVDPDLCDTSNIAILVRNTNQGNAYDVTTKIVLPFEGMEIVPGSVQIAYPSSAPYVSVPVDPYFSGVDTRGRIFQYDDFSQLSTFLDDNGLPGFNPSNPTDSNEFVIRYKFTTDCDFVSGSISHYELQGLKACGDSSNLETGETLPITINGAGSGVSKIFDIYFNEGSVLTPGAQSTIEITAINLTTALTDTTDKILLTLPLGLDYQLNSTIALNPLSWIITEPEIDTVLGFQKLYWCLPVGLTQNDSATLSLVLNIPNYNCNIDSLEVGLSTIFRQDLTCVATASNCDMESITSSNSGQLTGIRIDQKILDIDIDFISSTCASATQEQIVVDGTVINNGTDFPNAPFTIRYFNDVDNSNDYTIGDIEIANFIENGPLLFGESLVFQHAFLVDAGNLCNLFGLIDTTGLNLCNDAFFSIDNSQLINAGNDILICESTPKIVNANLGDPTCAGIAGYTYQWFAIAPATTADLNSTTIANPVFTTNYDGVTEDTLVYYVETTRPGCFGISSDTVQIILGAGVTLDLGTTIFLDNTPSVILDPNPIGGSLPYSYNWEPATTLDDPNMDLPEATPIQDSTLYFVTVTSAIGCTAIDSVWVVFGNPIIAAVSGDTSICAESTVQLIASGGTDYLWEENVGNPTFGVLNNLNIPNPIFSGGIENGIYNFDVIVTDTNFPGFADTAQVTITVFGAPVVLTPVGILDNCLSDITAINIELDQAISSYTIATNGTYSGDNISGSVLTFNAGYIGDTTTFSIEMIGQMNGCIVTETFQIIPCSCEAPQLNSIIIEEATCGNFDGAATIHLLESDSLYVYNWIPDVGTPQGIGNRRINLPFGGYTVEVSSVLDPTCITPIFVLVTNVDGPTATAVTTPATCQSSDGTATLDPPDYLYVWETPGPGAFRNDLAAGVYFVTLTDTINNPDCPNVMMLEIEEDNPLVASVTVNDYPDCGVNNGIVTIDVLNGSGSYTYEWNDGLSSNIPTRDSLFSGVYKVTIYDNDPTACEFEFLFVLTDSVGTATMSILDTLNISCAGGNNGAINFDINYLPTFAFPADTVITDGTFYYENGNLPAGSYCMYLGDAVGCFVAAACFEIEEPETMDLYLVVTPDCDNNGCVEVNVNGGTAPYTYDWAHLPGANDPGNICMLVNGTYGLIVTDSLGCTISENSVIIPSCVDSCEYFGGLDTLILDAPDCQSLISYCFNTSLQDIMQSQIFDNGVPYSLGVTGCDFDSLIIYDYSELFGQGALGPYEVISWTVNGSIYSGEFQDIPALIDSMNVWDPMDNWQTAQVGQFIIGGAPNSTYSSMVINAIDFGTSSELGINFSSIPNGYQLQLGIGYHEIVVLDTLSGCSDTLIAMIDCPNVINICLNEEEAYCVEAADLNVPGIITSMTNVCPDQSVGAVQFNYDSDNLCIGYSGLTIGTDTTCVAFCDALGNCDTIELVVIVDSCLVQTIDYVKDTIYINQTEVYCVDTTELPGNVVSISNYCADLSGDFVDYFIDPIGFCMEYTGVDLGVDSACVVICDDLGICDTTMFCVVVVEYFDPPVANPDTLCSPGIFEGSPVVLDVQANDILYGGVDSIYILTDPSWGTATINLDGSITFNADEEVCERIDSFQYVVCTPTGCDTSMVVICIECVDIVIFTAVSANGDGINDEFYIANIEEYPESKLQIFNRWGNQVYETINYKNDWRGTWNGNRDLPDGTYFYILELNDEANRVFKGYLELYR